MTLRKKSGSVGREKIMCSYFIFNTCSLMFKCISLTNIHSEMQVFLVLGESGKNDCMLTGFIISVFTALKNG